jgi:AraC-like DNA-binding protein
MSDPSSGVLYTEHLSLRSGTPIASLWSFHTCTRERDRRPLVINRDGAHEYWLDRSDPLLNTILPGMAVSLIVNVGDLWAAGRSLASSALIPRLSVIGPATHPRLLRVGQSVRAIGVVVPSSLSLEVCGAPASALVDRIVALDDLWSRDETERLLESVSAQEPRRALRTLRDGVMARVGDGMAGDALAHAANLITIRGGNVSIARLAQRHGLRRQEFARRFVAAAGVPPKLFARIARFQALVHTLLAVDVSRWASLSTSLGFYDQAHMINEFRALAGAPPTTFFRPHGEQIDPARIEVRGRPSEWLQ